MNTTHFERMALGDYFVYCDHGCNLGTSQCQPTAEKAAVRADLHDHAHQAAGPRPTSQPLFHD